MRHLNHRSVLAALLLAALCQPGCDEVVRQRQGALRLWLRLPPDEDFSAWGATHLRVSVEGDGLGPDSYEEVFQVSGSANRVGAMHEVPCNDEKARTIYVEALSREGDGTEVVGRGVSVPVLIPCGEDAQVTVFLARVDRFSFTRAFDPSRGEGRSDMKYPRSGHSTTILPDGRVLVAGGVALDFEGKITCDSLLSSIEVYYPGDGLWHESRSTLRSPRAYHSATRLRGRGSVLVLGGYGCVNNQVVSLVTGEIVHPWKLDTGEGAISLSSVMFQPRARHTAIQHNQGWVLIAGGEYLGASGQARVLDELEIFFTSPPENLAGDYCQNADTWTFCRTEGMRLATGRHHHGATAVIQEIFIFGGSDGENPLGSVERFFYNMEGSDLPGPTREGPAMSEPRQSMAWVSTNDRIFLFGGEGPDGEGGIRPLSSIDWYGPTTNSFQLGDLDLGSSRSETAAVLMSPGGWVLVAGGRGAAGEAISSAVALRIWRREQNNSITWGVLDSMEVGSLRKPRYGHHMVMLHNDQVLVTAGAASEDGSGVASQRSTEVFTPHPDFLQ